MLARPMICADTAASEAEVLERWWLSLSSVAACVIGGESDKGAPGGLPGKGGRLYEDSGLACELSDGSGGRSLRVCCCWRWWCRGAADVDVDDVCDDSASGVSGEVVEPGACALGLLWCAATERSANTLCLWSGWTWAAAFQRVLWWCRWDVEGDTVAARTRESTTAKTRSARALDCSLHP